MNIDPYISQPSVIEQDSSWLKEFSRPFTAAQTAGGSRGKWRDTVETPSASTVDFCQSLSYYVRIPGLVTSPL